MKNVAPMHSAVKNSRNGIRPAPRSENAPRIGETRALMPTLTTTAIGQPGVPVALAEPRRRGTARSRRTRPRTRRSCWRSRTGPTRRGRRPGRSGSVRPARGRRAGDRSDPRGVGGARHRPMIAGAGRVGFAHDRGIAHPDPPGEPAAAPDADRRASVPGDRPAPDLRQRRAGQGARSDRRAAVGRHPGPGRGSTRPARSSSMTTASRWPTSRRSSTRSPTRSGRPALVLDGFLTKQAIQTGGRRLPVVGRVAEHGLVHRPAPQPGGRHRSPCARRRSQAKTFKHRGRDRLRRDGPAVARRHVAPRRPAARAAPPARERARRIGRGPDRDLRPAADRPRGSARGRPRASPA